NWLAAHQNGDGGWGEDFSSYTANAFVPASSSVVQTFTPLIALMRYEKMYQRANGQPSPYRPAIDPAMQYISSQVLPDGSVVDQSFSGVIIRGNWFVNYQYVPQAFALLAFVQYAAL